MTLRDRQPQGIPTGGQFAATAHAEPETNLPATGNRFAGIDDVRELDAAASAALSPLLTPDAGGSKSVGFAPRVEEKTSGTYRPASPPKAHVI
jgi:hypothetical protein